MHVVYPVCCGLDVHQAQLTACLRRVSPEGQITLERREFGTTYGELLALSEWRAEHDCPVVALESTGVYWRPVYHVLVGTVEVLWGTPATSGPGPAKRPTKRRPPGSQSCLAHGLIRPSVVPPRDQRPARCDADAGGAGADPHPGEKSRPYSARRYEYQALQCRHRAVWQQWAADAARPGSRASTTRSGSQPWRWGGYAASCRSWNSPWQGSSRSTTGALFRGPET